MVRARMRREGRLNVEFNINKVLCAPALGRVRRAVAGIGAAFPGL
jgi:hypothetical protein